MTINRQDPSVIIIGAGMTGIQLVIKLKEAGINNITVLEKSTTIGGTWRENTYPGVACDVPSHAYTYSFAPNPDWSNLFPSGKEIYQYFESVFYQHDIDRYTNFSETVIRCVYNKQQWTVETQQGNCYTADLLFSATGILHQPVTPSIPGIDEFEGPAFHTARWDHSIDLAGKRIGVIGTGSTAAQLIPEIVKRPNSDVTVFQRTPQWITRVEDKVFTEQEKQRFREKPHRMQRFKRFALYIFELGTSTLTGNSWWQKWMYTLFSYTAKRNLNNSIKDPVLRAKLTPDYKFGCKRVIINSTYYDAIQQDNAHLVTDSIERVEAKGVRTSNGDFHPLDILVLSTGFDASAFMRPMEFIGEQGVTIEQAWQNKIQAYRSMLIPQFPNFFLMLGPNSPIGNYSIIAISEIQTDYAIQAIKLWQKGTFDTIKARPEAMEQWSAMLKSKMGKTVWTSGCNSWYLDADGDPLSWPDSWKNWVQAMSQIDLKDFVTEGH